jgi:hypothetical protein
MSLVKLQEAHKIGTTMKDTDGRTIAKSSLSFRDLYINPDHIISINEDVEATRSVGQKICRVETLRGVFSVAGSPIDIQQQLSPPEVQKSKRVLKD